MRARRADRAADGARGAHRAASVSSTTARRRRCSTRRTARAADPRPHGRLRASCSTRSPSTAPRSTSTRRSRSATASCTAARGSSSRRSITPLVEIDIDELVGARAAAQPGQPRRASSPREQAFPDVPHVAVFDTAFHQTLPPAAYTYAIDARARGDAPHPPLRVPRHLAQVRVSEAAAAFLGRPLERAQADRAATSATAHRSPRRRRPLGRDVDGADAARGARDGHAVGRHRPGGALPPRSGAPGLSIDEPRRPAQQAQRHARARRARRHARPRRGERARATRRRRSRSRCTSHRHPRVRRRLRSRSSAASTRSSSPRASARTRRSCAQWSLAGRSGIRGVELDPERNRERGARHPRRISTDASKVAVLVVPTNEELEIARQTLAVVGA